jgi:hypothetical protein
VIEDARDVVNLVTLLGKPQNEIIILATRKLGPKSAQLNDQRSSINPEMTRVHARKKRVRGPVGLKVRLAIEP